MALKKAQYKIKHKEQTYHKEDYFKKSIDPSPPAAWKISR